MELSMSTHQRIHTDGFLFRSNPSPIGGGYTVVDDDGTLIDRKAIKKEGLTSNEAELLAINRAVELVDAGGIVITDSMTVKKWIARRLSLIHISEPTRPY